MKSMQEITGIKIDYSQLPKERSSSMHPEAIKYRKALARASNAIEGVTLNDNDKKFMDSLPFDMSEEDFQKAVLKHIESERK